MPIIDNKIHFIWAGGATMPDKNLSVVKEWYDKNPAYQITLWVDKATTPPSDLEAFYKRVKETCPNAKVLDITEEGVINPAIRHELDKNKPNFGKSSDMLRLLILLKKGGIYLDSDVYPDNPLPEQIEAEHGILFSSWTQGHHNIGNDILMCTAGNETMRKLAKDVIESYCSPYWAWLNKNDERGRDRVFLSPYNYEQGKTKLFMTLMQTGPVFIRKMLHEYGIITLSRPQASFLELMAREKRWHIDNAYLIEGDKNNKHKPHFIKDKGGNDQSWLKEKEITSTKEQSYEDKLKECCNLISFEIEHTNFLRLNEYIQVLNQYNLFKSPMEIANDLIKSLSDSLSPELIEKIKGAQLVPYMACEQGISFFNHALKNKKDGLYLYHLAQLEKMTKESPLTKEVTQELLVQIATTFSDEELFYFGKFDSQMISPLNRVVLNPSSKGKAKDELMDELVELVKKLELGENEVDTLREHLHTILYSPKASVSHVPSIKDPNNNSSDVQQSAKHRFFSSADEDENNPEEPTVSPPT